ncbi:MAG: histidine phosphatase family protein [Patescibacteria group bacterium]|nr:histidine phosphatase family protein [Patescibacteria group bacterium]
MKLFLVRHGESEGNVDRGFIAGRTDSRGLTVKGRVQITRTAWQLRKLHFDHLYCSPVARAVESAQILSRLLSVDYTKVPFLEEMSYGDYEGEYFWVNIEKKRADFHRWNTDMDFAFPNGESLRMVSDRVWNGYQDWLAGHDRDKKVNILFVSHDVIISTLLFCLMYGHPDRDATTPSYRKAFVDFVHTIEVPNASVYEIDLHASPLRFRLHEYKTPAVTPTVKSLQFYLGGIAGYTDVSLEEKVTASENMVYHVTNGADAIVKIIREREIVSSERIVLIYAYLESKTEIDAPHVLNYDKSRIFFRDTVLLQDYKPGEDLMQYFSRNTGCSKHLMDQAFTLLKQIHSIPLDDVAEYWYPEDSWHKVHIPWRNFMADEVDFTISQLAVVLPDRGIEMKVRRELEILRRYVASESVKLVPLHGDFSPQNIVLTSDGKLRVLDFERARIGDSLWDYGYFYGWLQRKQPELAEYWDGLIRNTVSDEQFGFYRRFAILFHAWTLRDVLEYKGNPIRAERAEVSRKILLEWAGKTDRPEVE